MDLIVRTRGGPPPGAQPVEVVERKGPGHPDSICDGIAEEVCVRLCRHYLGRFGTILHHNVDKVLLCGGAAAPTFGGGEVLEPIEIYLAGRATQEHGGVRVPVHDIAIDACRGWLRTHLPGLDIERHVRIVSRIRPGSSDLTGLFARAGASPPANDTSCGAGFAPLTDLEKAVLAAERALVGREAGLRPEVGSDTKVMGVRIQRRIHLTMSCAFVGRFVSGRDDYAQKKESARKLVAAAVRGVTPLPVEVSLNAADDLERGDLFLTVTGTSAEAGDDGEAGRGNRVCGLITPYRPMTLEAAAGKNPVSHVGKLYNLVASRMAAAIANALPAAEDTACVVVSQIGRPVDDPQVVDVALAADESAINARVRATVADIAHEELTGLGSLRDELLAGRITVY